MVCTEPMRPNHQIQLAAHLMQRWLDLSHQQAAASISALTPAASLWVQNYLHLIGWAPAMFVAAHGQGGRGNIWPLIPSFFEAKGMSGRDLQDTMLRHAAGISGIGFDVFSRTLPTFAPSCSTEKS